jgi:CRISPR-associated endonuclease Csn1
MSKIIGLDVGIASLGWCVLDLEKQKIKDAGVRIFTKAETPKTGSSLAEPRRLARSMRRRIRRRQHRLERIKNLFVDSHLISETLLNQVFMASKDLPSPWQLRSDGLSRKLNGEELSRALFHIARRRGFKSNRKSELTEKDVGKLLKGVNSNTLLLEEGGYTTLGEMFYKDPKFKSKKRNHPNFYGHTVARDLLVSEVNILFERQRDFGSDYSSTELQDRYLDIFLSQRSYDDGDQINRMRGFCTFESDQRRAPKLSYSAECFVLASKCNNLTFSEEGKGRKHLSLEQKKLLMDLPWQPKKVTYRLLREKLDIPENARFVGLDYYQAEKQGKDPEAQTFMELKGFHGLRKAVEKYCGKTDWVNLLATPELLDSIVEILTCWKTDDNRQRELQTIGVSQKLIDAVLPLDGFSQFINLSNTAINRLLPLMLKGLRFDEACREIYPDHCRDNGAEKQKLLPPVPLEDIRNPVVFRAVTQARKVINAIIRKHGSADRIHIELARDVAKSFKERKRIEKAQGEFRTQKERAREHFTSLYGQIPNGHDLLKFRLHKAQSGRCPYSGSAIDSSRLVEPGYVDIDHILPWSRTYDDTMNNKVLVLTGENRQKGNRTPFEYIAKEKPESINWQRFKAGVAHYPHAKRWRLLKENLDDREMEGFRERNANDNSYIARYLKNFIEKHLQMAGDERQPVQTSNGVLTNYLRVRWGLLKDRGQSDRHHAIDALLVASITRSMIKQLSDASRRQELWASDAPRDFAEELVDQHTGEVVTSSFQQNRKIQLPQPWSEFSQHVREYVENEVFVSRMPYRKISGVAHQETVRSAKCLDQGYALVKTPLSKLTLANLDNMHDKERNLPLYQSLKARLGEYDGNGKKAFEEPFYMPPSSKGVKLGRLAPCVYSVKLRTPMNDGVYVNKGITAHDKMIRTDVFEKSGKYYLVPIYVADRVKFELPNRAITASKLKQDWPEMDDSYAFCFSLFRNDLIEIKHRTKGVLMGYYAGCHSGTASINVTLPDRSLPIVGNKWVGDKKLSTMRKKGEKEIQGIGVKAGLDYFHKYEVDVLGSISRVRDGGSRLGLA